MYWCNQHWTKIIKKNSSWKKFKNKTEDNREVSLLGGVSVEYKSEQVVDGICEKKRQKVTT